MTELAVTPAWHAQARCTQSDPDLWYPEKGDPGRTAKAICAECDCRTECLAWALKTREPHGIWGGVSARDRGKTLGYIRRVEGYGDLADRLHQAGQTA